MSYEKYYPNGWQSGETGGTPITPEALNHMDNGIADLDKGKAPSGYGLGEVRSKHLDITEMSQLDGIYTIGWYSFNFPTIIQVNGVWLNYAYMLVENWDVSSVKQTLYALNAESTTLTRRKFEGVWQPWECENPPMLLGVEYRTTERWNGKAVYTRLINAGKLPNASTMSVNVNVDMNEAVNVLRCSAYCIADGTSIGLPFNSGSSYQINCHPMESSVVLYSSYDASGYTAYVQAWYIKD